MDFDSIASEMATDHGIGTAKKNSELDAIAKSMAEDHGIEPVVIKKGRLYVSPVAPPRSGFTKEQSDELNRQPSVKGGENPREIIPPTSVQESMANAGIVAKQLAGQGVEDIQSGHPYKGAAKVIGGALSGVLSPITGAIEGGPEKLGTEISGNPDIGSRLGFVIGSALPIAPGSKAIVGAIPKNKAFNTLVESIGPENVGNVAKEMRANSRLTPADLSPATRQTVQKLFVTEGDKTKNYLAETVQGRLQSAKQAVESAFDTSMGKIVDPVAKLKELSDNIKAVGAKEINPVLKATKPVDLTPVIEHIDNTLKPGVTHVISNPESMLPYNKVQKLLEGWRGQLTNDKTILTSPDVLNKIQSNIRRQAEQLMRTPDAESKAMGYALFQLRNKMIDAIGKAGPQTVDKEGKAISSYRAGLSKYKDENDVATAFEHGHDAIIKNSRNLEDHPSYFENWVKQATDGEKEAAREGARVAYDTQVNGFKNAARRGTDIGQSEFNHRRMEALFGKEKADEMFKKLEHERLIAETNSDLVKGSQTAMRMTADSRIALPTMKEVGHNALSAAALEVPNILGGGYAGVGTAAFGALKTGNYIKHEIATKLAKEHNANYAKLALPVEGPSRDELIKSLEAVANKNAFKLPIAKKLSLAFKP
jgi:hypothetical protein